MAKKSSKSYSKFTFEDLKALGLEVLVVDLFGGENIPPVAPSGWLVETLKRSKKLSLATEKAKSEFIIAPILNELQENNDTVFSLYSGFNFDVDKERGLQGFCDFLLAKLPLKVVPDAPIIAVVEAKLNDVITAAVPQCAAEMYATRLWNERYKQPQQVIYGVITTGNNWLFLRFKEGMTIEVDLNVYPLNDVAGVLGILQHIVNQYK
jgi:hypothetical protein